MPITDPVLGLSKIPAGPDPVCGASPLSGLKLAVQHITNPSRGEKKALGRWPREGVTGGPVLWIPQEVGNRAGWESGFQTPGAGRVGTALWQGYLARPGAVSQQIKQEHDNFQDRPLQMLGPPCCVQDPGPAKSTFLHRSARKGVTLHLEDSSRRLPASRSQSPPTPQAPLPLQWEEHYDLDLGFLGGLLSPIPPQQRGGPDSGHSRGRGRARPDPGLHDQPAQDGLILGSEPGQVLSPCGGAASCQAG